jgi:hypothetical protein
LRAINAATSMPPRCLARRDPHGDRGAGAKRGPRGWLGDVRATAGLHPCPASTAAPADLETVTMRLLAFEQEGYDHHRATHAAA